MLAAFVAGSKTKVAILLLRPGTIYMEFQEPLRRFAQIDPVISDCCKRFWSSEGEPVTLNEVIPLISFRKTSAQLASAGLFPKGNWLHPKVTEIDTELEAFEERGDMLLEEVFFREIK